VKTPQPYEELDHTADLGVIVRGATADETLERLVCVFGQLLVDRVDIEPSTTKQLSVSGAPDRAVVAVDVLRELLFQFATTKAAPASCRVLHFDGHSAEVEVGFAQPVEGAGEMKAVTYHEAAFERAGDEWVARVIFDI
jgi:protein archease